MGPSPTTLSKGKLRVVRQWLLQRYEHQPFVSCLAGLYGCQWRRYQRTHAQPGSCCCRKLECGSFALIVLTFCLSLVFLYFWSEAQNDYNDFDWFNFGHVGFWFPWSMVLLVIAAAFFVYVTVLLLLAVCLLSEGQKLYLHWGHKIGILVTLTFSTVATAVLSDLWNKEWKTLLLSFQITAPYLHVGGVLLITLLSWPIALHFFRFNVGVSRAAIMGVYLVVLCALYLVPLGMYSPCIKKENTLGPAPALIGHRGSPMLAPENTYMSFEKAVEAGGDGLETDVTISYDGVPFLMHDKNLQRTTNMQDVFPNRTDASAAMFVWSELEMLDAGSWFLSQDPFGTASWLDPEERVQAQNQSVCTLRAFLDLAAKHGKLVIFDLYRPPRGHPYRDAWITRTLEVIQNEILHPLQSELRAEVQEMDPDLQQTSGSRAPLEHLQQGHIVKLNLHYSSTSKQEISKYAAVNISTNLYVISQPWLYSLAWCAGAQSVTTNAPHLLKNLRRPLFLMTPEEYRQMWILTDVLSCILIIIIAIFHWWRERGLVDLCMNRQGFDNGTNSKFRTEMNAVWSITSVDVSGGARNPNAGHNTATFSEQQGPDL